MTRLAAAVTLLATGCSAITVKELPKSWNGVDPPTCSTSYGPPVVDGLVAALSGFMVYTSQTAERENDVDTEPFLVVMAIPGLIFLASGVKGALDVAECRRAHRSVMVAP